MPFFNAIIPFLCIAFLFWWLWKLLFIAFITNRVATICIVSPVQHSLLPWSCSSTSHGWLHLWFVHFFLQASLGHPFLYMCTPNGVHDVGLCLDKFKRMFLLCLTNYLTRNEIVSSRQRSPWEDMQAIKGVGLAWVPIVHCANHSSWYGYALVEVPMWWPTITWLGPLPLPLACIIVGWHPTTSFVCVILPRGCSRMIHTSYTFHTEVLIPPIPRCPQGLVGTELDP